MRLTLSVFALVGTLGIGYATMAAAQPQREIPAQNIDVRDDGDDGFDAGWLGLIGLAGLLGMKRSEGRDRTVTRDSSVSAAR